MSGRFRRGSTQARSMSRFSILVFIVAWYLLIASVDGTKQTRSTVCFKHEFNHDLFSYCWDRDWFSVIDSQLQVHINLETLRQNCKALVDIYCASTQAGFVYLLRTSKVWFIFTK